ncbi:cyclase family protein [Desulfolutivibrio sulfoxidireducens]|uniref:cyclase family protein n=1 Tax=Desulfolutivibrio sulfoxidireducens TaxID=2773299 RepID=UPI00159E4959|nr:cyclase family protein [Desulfolutivibrio sulfoxidireducens]QLA16830.1 cyclase family protein [Desulfolutivibrio sulfoxidireducens]
MPSPWIDISLPLREGMAVWPGDPPTRLRRVQDLAVGDSCTLTAIEMCAHAGTHLDAPAHHLRDGPGIEGMPVEAGIGPARVIAIADTKAITAGELARHAIRRGERLLFKTANSARPATTDVFSQDFVHITADAARFLARRKVRLVGVDALSVGAFAGDGGEVHRELLGAGVWLLEGLDLSRVAPGPVRLVCLPLRIPGADGAPARAVVRPMGRRGTAGGRGNRPES